MNGLTSNCCASRPVRSAVAGALTRTAAPSSTVRSAPRQPALYPNVLVSTLLLEKIVTGAGFLRIRANLSVASGNGWYDSRRIQALRQGERGLAGRANCARGDRRAL